MYDIVHARPHMLRLDGRLALVRGLLRPSSELSGAGSRGADQLVGRKVERDAAEPGQRGRGWDRERRSRSESPSDGKAGPGFSLHARWSAGADGGMGATSSVAGMSL